MSVERQRTFLLVSGWAPWGQLILQAFCFMGSQRFLPYMAAFGAVIIVLGSEYGRKCVFIVSIDMWTWSFVKDERAKRLYKELGYI